MLCKVLIYTNCLDWQSIFSKFIQTLYIPCDHLPDLVMYNFFKVILSNSSCQCILEFLLWNANRKLSWMLSQWSIIYLVFATLAKILEWFYLYKNLLILKVTDFVIMPICQQRKRTCLHLIRDKKNTKDVHIIKEHNWTGIISRKMRKGWFHSLPKAYTRDKIQ
jgi:hypothetical protein